MDKAQKLKPKTFSENLDVQYGIMYSYVYYLTIYVPPPVTTTFGATATAPAESTIGKHAYTA